MTVHIKISSLKSKLLILIASLFFLNPCFAELNKKELNCLNLAIYKEARGESILGQQLVAKVILNRVKDPSFPNSVCKVVFQPKQFSWYNQGKTEAIGRLLKGSTRGLKPKDIAAYQEAQFIALTMIKEEVELPKKYNKALYFVHTKVAGKLKWLTKKKFLGKVGSHRFYGNKE